jgi:ribosomal protein L11 methyltransferase
MNYIELDCVVSDPVSSDILMANLAELGFESFVELDAGFLAYIPESHFKISSVNAIQMVKEKQVSFTWKTIEEQNWNQIWESQYDPVIIDDLCTIRAPFHKPHQGTLYEIIIEPKMSFGTGHHETTSMMVRLLGEMDIKGFSVLDMGCGTGILAILAYKMGASSVTAIDNEEWAYQNSIENINRNLAAFVKVLLGDASLIQTMPPASFDLIMANINRNVLLLDMEKYADALKPTGSLLLSGFYQADRASIIRSAGQFSLEEVSNLIENDWMALHLRKN